MRQPLPRDSGQPRLFGRGIQVLRLSLFAFVVVLVYVALTSVDDAGWDRCVAESVASDMQKCKDMVDGGMADVAATAVFAAVGFQTVVPGFLSGLTRRVRSVARAGAFLFVVVAVVLARRFFSDFGAISGVGLALTIFGALLVWASDEVADPLARRKQTTWSVRIAEEQLGHKVGSRTHPASGLDPQWLAQAHEGRTWRIALSHGNERHLLQALHRLADGKDPCVPLKAARLIGEIAADGTSRTVVLESSNAWIIADPGLNETRLTVHFRGSTEIQAGVNAIVRLMSTRVDRGDC